MNALKPPFPRPSKGTHSLFSLIAPLTHARYRYAAVSPSMRSRYSLTSRSSMRFLIMEISGLNRPASWLMTSVVSWVCVSSLRCLYHTHTPCQHPTYREKREGKIN